MIDLHCHILPGIDDGPACVEEAGAMLELQRKSGVKRMILTPHYYPERMTLEQFLAERAQAWERLCPVAPQESLQMRLGAEVRYGRELLSLDLRKLTLGQSDYLLLELPGSRYPAYTAQFMEQLLEKGLIPVLAHVERYAYFREEPELLKQLIDLGALAQVSAQALFDRRDKHFSAACLEHGLAQIVASDAHDLSKRKPCMELVRQLPGELQQLHNTFSDGVWENMMPEYIRTSCVKKTFFGYR